MANGLNYAIIALIALVAVVAAVGIIISNPGGWETPTQGGALQNMQGGATNALGHPVFMNGDFEAGSGKSASGWKADTGCNDRYGCWSRKLINGDWQWWASTPANNGWSTPLDQAVPLQPSTEYTLEFDYECLTATAQNTNSWHFRFRDQSKPCCKDAFTNQGTAALTDGSTISKPMSRFSCAKGEKGRFSGTFTTPADFNPAGVHFRWWAIANANAKQEILIDDLEVCEGTCGKFAQPANGELEADVCTINPTTNFCKTELSWSSENVQEPKVQVRVVGWKGEQIFRCINANTAGSGMTGEWIGPTGMTVRLYTASDCTLTSTGELLDEIKINPVVPFEPHRGVFFNPETYINGVTPVGNAWMTWYPNVRDQVKEELRQLKQETDMDLVVISGSAFLRFSWPTPTAQELDNVATFIKDADAAGFKVSIGIGHPFIVPEESRITGIQKELVCGHKKGETVNSFKLFWDVPDCPETEAQLFAASKAWYSAVIQGLESRGAGDGLAYYAVHGHYGIPFAAEMNMFDDSDPYLREAQRYVQVMIPYLTSITDVPIAPQLQPSWQFTTQDNSRVDYSFIENFFDVVDINTVGYIDITSSPKVDPEEILRIIGGENAYKVILSDFKPGYFMGSGWTQAEVIEQQTAVVEENGLGGWWYWVYRDFQGGAPDHIGLREKRATKTTVDSAWRKDAIAALD